MPYVSECSRCIDRAFVVTICKRLGDGMQRCKTLAAHQIIEQCRADRMAAHCDFAGQCFAGCSPVRIVGRNEAASEQCSTGEIIARWCKSCAETKQGARCVANAVRVVVRVGCCEIQYSRNSDIEWKRHGSTGEQGAEAAWCPCIRQRLPQASCAGNDAVDRSLIEYRQLRGPTPIRERIEVQRNAARLR